MTELTLGYSSCPNDTFIFYPLVHKKIDTGDIKFREILEDVETLNTMARENRLDITKISFHTYGYIKDQYQLLRTGGAMGRGCGPLVVAKNFYTMEELKGKRVAIPGNLTTAYLLLQLYDPSLRNNTVAMPFHTIMDSVKNGSADAGLIIHEGRFTYQDYGLNMLIDLGEWWEKETGLPIPLGGIVIKKTIENSIINSIESFIRESVLYSTHHRDETMVYIKRYAQELSDSVIARHIKLYVNEFTLNIGKEGQDAVNTLFNRANEKGIF